MPDQSPKPEWVTKTVALTLALAGCLILNPLASFFPTSLSASEDVLLDRKPDFATSAPTDLDQQLRNAARQNDASSLQALLAAGADPNATFRDGSTALVYAAQRGHVETLRLLLGHGADPDARSIMNQATALHFAIGYPEAVKLLVASKADVNREDLNFLTSPLGTAVIKRCRECLEALLASEELEPETIYGALKVAEKGGFKADGKLLREALETSGWAPSWPQFRGRQGTGVADGHQPPAAWDASKGQNVLWKTRLPGMGHSSPIAWGDRVFVTTAVSSLPHTDLRPGGPMAESRDTSPHRWQLLCLDRKTGKILWQQTAFEGEPRTARNPKNSYASETPATDGERVVAFFGSHGLYAYSMDGELLWRKDLGALDSGFFFDPDYQWGTASSPVLFEDQVIIQADGQEASFIAAFDLATGELRWKTLRDELPTWSTPALYQGKPAPELITNGVNAIRSYDPRTGELLWHLDTGNSAIAASTPVISPELILIGNGYRPLRPIYAVKPGARGDLSLGLDQLSSDAVVWSRKSGGPYYITPLVYRDQLYILYETGILNSYYIQTGELIYKARVGDKGASFSASPIAADGKLFLASENGKIYTLAAGLEYHLLASNPVGEMLMSTPAILDGMLIARGRNHLFAIGEITTQEDQVDAPTVKAELTQGSTGTQGSE